MHRHATGSAFDISIHGDDLEKHRIQLEHNLQNTELSFRLSSSNVSDDDEPFPQNTNQRRHRRQDSSLEYPRHVSEPSVADYPSFVYRSREHPFGDDEHSHTHRRGWSYRSADDDDEGISPYGGETMSTAAHHASALTLTTGIGGGRAARRDPSLSGAEYDPERPIHAMIAGVNSKHSLFDRTSMGMTYDPLVVDSTAELDRILESGHAPPPTASGRAAPQPPSPISSGSASTSDSDARHPISPSRPKLADHLRHVSFSPKRPRAAALAQTNTSAPAPPATSPLARRRQQQLPADDSMYVHSNAPTPRAARQPEVRVHAATPSSAASKFTRMVRGINKELEGAQAQLQQRPAPPSATVPIRPASVPLDRNPFHDPPPDPPRHVNTQPAPRRPSAMKDPNASTNTTRGKIHLPDVTGLTAAVESPAKATNQYYKYAGNAKARESEARLLQTLSAVQGQLHELEEENGISRRRVRELEMELEECKREVARERTRLFEREEAPVEHYTRGKAGKSKGQGGLEEMDDEKLHARYKEAVDEKKALEALITSLRTHLTRLTTELAAHQELLTALRELRDADAAALRAHSGEILHLRTEVQRLAGEVEVLRGVVEEGLKERRASREMSRVEVPEEDRGMSRDLDEQEDDEDSQDGDFHPNPEDEEEDRTSVLEHTNESEPEPFDPASLLEERQNADRTMRTDFATLGESTNTRERERERERFDVDELNDITTELAERRANRSSGSIRTSSPPPRSHAQPQHHRATVNDTQDIDAPSSQPHPTYQQQQQQNQRNSRTRAQAEPSSSRPAAPTPSHAARRAAGSPGHGDRELETPFPQIRGEQLERLFFSAPAHNAATCTVCFRHDRKGGHAASANGWSRPAAASTHARRERDGHSDEGYAGSEGSGEGRFAGRYGRDGAEADREASAEAEALLLNGDTHQWRTVARRHGIPPQTVVARVIRNLEDDFTHYKSIYVELADQYKVMDAASNVRRRNTLARHLREVVDVLEQKGDQIASLYDLLQFKDKPASESVAPQRGSPPTAGPSWGHAQR